MLILPKDVGSEPEEQGTNSAQDSASSNHVNPSPNQNRYRSPEVEDTEDAEMDPPPTYSESVGNSSGNTGNSTTSTGSSTSNSSSTTAEGETPLRSTPTNFLSYYDQNSSITGCYTIDPSMIMPASALPPLNPGQSPSDRKNLSFYSQNGTTKAEIWLLGPGANSTAPPKQATLSLESQNGTIRAWVDNVNRRVPVKMDAFSQNGNVTVYIPRTFHGFIFVSARNCDSILSAAVNARATLLGQTHGKRRYFVGDISLADEERWTSDELDIGSMNGSVRVGYVDEDGAGNNAPSRSYTYSTTTGGNNATFSTSSFNTSTRNNNGTPPRRNTYGGRRGFFSGSTNTNFTGRYNVVVGTQVNNFSSTHTTTYGRPNGNPRDNANSRQRRTSTYSMPGGFDAHFPNVSVNVSTDDVNGAQGVNVSSWPGFVSVSRLFGYE